MGLVYFGISYTDDNGFLTRIASTSTYSHQLSLVVISGVVSVMMPTSPHFISGIRCLAAEGRATDLERRLVESEGRATDAEQRLTDSEESLREFEGKLQQLETQWVVERREIQLTGPELGRGGWATVSVATFRGVRVAAKCIHNQIISGYNIYLFEREMDMAARIRHPNLLQFIGATRTGELIILTELMPTSLPIVRGPRHSLPLRNLLELKTRMTLPFTELVLVIPIQNIVLPFILSLASKVT